MEKTKEIDIRFETVRVECPRCKNLQNEVIIVSRNVGILDAKCKRCKKRVVELKIFG
ncbi:hypothetical protein SAMN06265182_0664 [Persephonella hydrogeniphila]|uniref:Mu-like prophage protein Com n=1 Tax=Persephonella hydrogeniphila TaxID=198703 RepID=A0A285NAA1_9AQUI|nr:hypothetical protein [Persephonella hydrogeniphila]SNZ06402.1 hypothetical protein SAMN06265182_0664 [Persephonella hydrogeniphila]